MDTSHQDPLLEQGEEEDDQDGWTPARQGHDGEVAILCVNVDGRLVEKQAHVASKVLDECRVTDAIGLQKETMYCTWRR